MKALSFALFSGAIVFFTGALLGWVTAETHQINASRKGYETYAEARENRIPRPAARLLQYSAESQALGQPFAFTFSL